MKKFLIASVPISLMRNIAFAQDAPSASASPSPSPAGTEETERVIVQNQEMDITREAIVPSLGATGYIVGPDRLDSQAGGENAPFNQTLLRFPGVAQDSFGQLDVRGEHANLQYRIDDVLIPESIPGFGQVLETRFADNISLITGALPAQFGFRNTGVIDIHTKNGAVFQQGDATVYGGSFDTIMPSFEYGGVNGKLNYYWTGSYLRDGIGIGVDGSGPGARVHLGGPRQCLRVDILPDVRQFAISNGNGEDPMVLERLIRGFDSPRSEADDQNPVSLRYEFGGLWV